MFEICKHGDEDRAAKPFELPIANHNAIL